MTPARDESGNLDAPPRRGRQRQGLRRQRGRAHAASRAGRHGRERRRHCGAGLRRLDGRRARRDRRGARQARRPRRRKLVRPCRGPLDGARARSRRSATTRRPTPSRTSRPVSSIPTTARVRTRTARGQEIDQGWRTNIGFAELQGHLPEPARARPVPLDLRLDVHVRAALRRPHLLRRAVHRDRAQLRRAPLPAAPALDPDPPVRDPGVPVAARLARAPERRLRGRQRDPARSTFPGSSTRSGRASRACSSTSGSGSPTCSSSAPVRSSRSPGR